MSIYLESEYGIDWVGWGQELYWDRAISHCYIQDYRDLFKIISETFVFLVQLVLVGQESCEVILWFTQDNRMKRLSWYLSRNKRHLYIYLWANLCVGK